MESLVVSSKTGFEWLDIENPSEADLEQVSSRLGVPLLAIRGALDPKHLPKYEAWDDVAFILMRAADEGADPLANSVQTLTNKVAILRKGALVVTIHRRHLASLAQLQTRWKNAPPTHRGEAYGLICEILKGALLSFERLLNESEDRLEDFEEKIFRQTGSPVLLEELYFFKRRLTLLQKVVRLDLDIAYQIDDFPDRIGYMVEDVKEDGERVSLFADALIENVNNLFNIQISLSSHRTNEIVRVLTIFSAFFLPLTFLVGVYGMNFEHMPGLHWKYGYHTTWVLMAAITLAIFLWFRKKGWLK